MEGQQKKLLASLKERAAVLSKDSTFQVLQDFIKLDFKKDIRKSDKDLIKAAALSWREIDSLHEGLLRGWICYTERQASFDENISDNEVFSKKMVDDVDPEELLQEAREKFEDFVKKKPEVYHK